MYRSSPFRLPAGRAESPDPVAEPQEKGYRRRELRYGSFTRP